MVRVKRGNVARKRRKKILKFAKGFTGAGSRLFRVANGQVMKSLRYSYIGRKRRKRDFKKLWVCRINNHLKERFFFVNKWSRYNYSRFRYDLSKFCLFLNTKMISELLWKDRILINMLITFALLLHASVIFRNTQPLSRNIVLV